MEFAPDLSERIARARSDLRMGVPVVIAGQEVLLVQAIETLGPERFDAARSLSAETHVVITARRAETLKTAAYDGDLARIALPSEVGLGWVQALVDPATDLANPMKGPLHAMRGGDVAAQRVAVQLCKDARLLPAVLVTPLAAGLHFATEQSLTVLPQEATGSILGQAVEYSDVVHARLPMEVSETGRLHVFRPDDGGEEHYAVEVGRVDRDAPVLTRLHSACVTGDLMGSLKCDCGPQLRAAMRAMGDEGAGVLLYLNQEGRGIGLANKMRAYSLQDQGYDTVEANHRLGFEDDERDFRIGAALLKQMGIERIRLLTNNPAKIAMMEATGIAVEKRVPLKVGENAHNHAYLAVKAAKSGHML